MVVLWRQAQESRTAGVPAAPAPKRADLMSLLESNRGSLAGSGYGLGFRMALPKMPSFRVSGNRRRQDVWGFGVVTMLNSSFVMA